MAAPLSLDRQLHTPVGDAPVIPVAMIVLGGYLCWFAIHYWASDTAWPSDPVKALLTGKGLPTPDKTALPAAIAGLQAGASGAQLAKGPAENLAGGTATGAGGTMTHADLMNLWQANGGSIGTADIAAAIALAESSGRAAITSSNPDGGTNVGLWQLDTKGAGCAALLLASACSLVDSLTSYTPPEPLEGPQEEGVWAVLDEARRITRDAAGEQS